ncbi:calcium-activated potassium channel subunit beta-1 isoform X4 [Zonotrichia leucophrys gambelii]|uniref:calcium-activated potassium channel subunit beta-1 isoform X4 n=1 Tax=Zonotrichia leucophrys gambelii TaxID=257770 RepID=UPI00314098F4
MLGKKLVTAQKRGETRALCLGLGMVACSMMMYFFIGITIVPFYTKSVWTTETVCKVWVNLTASGQEVMLYQTEDTLERNPKTGVIDMLMERGKSGMANGHNETKTISRDAKPQKIFAHMSQTSWRTLKKLKHE